LIAYHSKLNRNWGLGRSHQLLKTPLGTSLEALRQGHPNAIGPIGRRHPLCPARIRLAQTCRRSTSSWTARIAKKTAPSRKKETSGICSLTKMWIQISMWVTGL